jgi:hypothetical protein
MKKILLGILIGIISTIVVGRVFIVKTFKPVEDCLIQIHYYYGDKDGGIQWTVSDFELHQDWEKNKDRQCDVEVGTKLHNFLQEFRFN